MIVREFVYEYSLTAALDNSNKKLANKKLFHPELKGIKRKVASAWQVGDINLFLLFHKINRSVLVCPVC